MPNATQSAPTAQGSSGTARVHKIASRIYGVLGVLMATFLFLSGALAIAARSTGSTYGGIIEKPAAVSGIYGPYILSASIVLIVLAVLIFTQRTIGAIAFLGFSVANEIVGYLVPALNVDGVWSFTLVDAIVYAILLTLTAIVIIAERVARSVKG